MRQEGPDVKWEGQMRLPDSRKPGDTIAGL